jgi:lipopolysaccharide/colanic/teichoic acid biosynthesis glycosyltransferase
LIKRTFDLLISLMTLILLSPLLVAIALWIKLDSPGPVFYRGVRVGRNGQLFRIFKFRTMVADADQIGPPSTAADDPRITRAGKILRRLNLDELPQFINVLLGEMSIVGPRPEVPEVVELYPEEERRLILSVRPGITDWATLWIRNEGERLRGSPNPHQKYLEEIWPEKRRLQLKYVMNQSFWIDLKIIALTLKVHFLDRLRGLRAGLETGEAR